MSYLSDSDVVADYLKGIPQSVRMVSSLVSGGIAISIVTYGETYDGVYGSRDPRAAEHVFRQFLHAAVVLSLNRTIMRRFASVRRDLRSRGLLIQDMDMLSPPRPCTTTSHL